MPVPWLLVSIGGGYSGGGPGALPATYPSPFTPPQAGPAPASASSPASKTYDSSPTGTSMQRRRQRCRLVVLAVRGDRRHDVRRVQRLDQRPRSSAASSSLWPSCPSYLAPLKSPRAIASRVPKYPDRCRRSVHLASVGVWSARLSMSFLASEP